MLEFSQFLINNFAYNILHLFGNLVTFICDGTRPQSVIKLNKGIYTRLSRSNTARGSCTGFVTVGSTKSIFSTNDPSVVKNKNARLTKLTQYLSQGTIVLGVNALLINQLLTICQGVHITYLNLNLCYKVTGQSKGLFISTS